MKTQFNIFLSICVLTLIVGLIVGIRYLYYKIKTEKYTKWYNMHYDKYIQDNNISLQDNYRNIFCYWDNDDLPLLINECIKKIKRQLSSKWNIILLNKNSIYKLIPNGNFPKNYDKLLYTQSKADWIRLYLIKTYGGLWLDISILLNDPQEIEDMYDKLRYDINLCIYEMSHHRINVNKIEYPGIENWFLMAKPDNELISLWLKEYEYAIDIGFEHYTNYIHKNKFELSVQAKGNDYLAAYQSIQVVMQKYNINFDKIYVKNAKNTMYKIVKISNDNIIKNKVNHNVKLTRFDRAYLENNLKEFLDIYFNENNENISIPKKIYQTYSSKYLVPSKVFDAIKKYAPEYNYYFFDDDNCVDFITSNFDISVINAYNNLENTAHKADLFRYCVLYVYGGIYLDIKTVLIKPLADIFNGNYIYSSLSIVNNTIYQGIIATPPRKQFFLDLIEYIVNTKTIDNYHVFTNNFYTQVEKYINYKKILPGINKGKENFYLFEEKCTANENDCIGGLDRYGRCCYMYDKDKKIFQVRYSDFPWK